MASPPFRRWDVLFPSERVVKVVVLKKEMVLSTTFALAQRHSRREMNGNNKMTSFLAGMSCFPSERVVKVVVDYKKTTRGGGG